MAGSLNTPLLKNGTMTFIELTWQYVKVNWCQVTANMNYTDLRACRRLREQIMLQNCNALNLLSTVEELPTFVLSLSFPRPNPLFPAPILQLVHLFVPSPGFPLLSAFPARCTLYQECVGIASWWDELKYTACLSSVVSLLSWSLPKQKFNIQLIYTQLVTCPTRVFFQINYTQVTWTG